MEVNLRLLNSRVDVKSLKTLELAKKMKGLSDAIARTS